MSAGTRQKAMVALAEMPFIDCPSLAAVCGMAERSAYEAVADLERIGLAANVPHAAYPVRPMRRFHLTGSGLRLLALDREIALDELLGSCPVSSAWLRILLGRLDAVAVIYRLAAAIAGEEGPVELRWYRGLPLDAAIALPGDRTVGVVRQGHTSDRTGFARRLWRLREMPRMSGTLVLASDEMRLRHTMNLLAGAPLVSLVALERDAAGSGPGDQAWRLPSTAAAMDLRRMLSHIERAGALPEECTPSRIAMPGDIAADGARDDFPDHLLPALLRSAEKRTLDILFDWPWITQKDLAGLLGVSAARVSQMVASLEGFGLVTCISETGRLLALTDRGLALLVRRDRTSWGVAKRRWSISPGDQCEPLSWRNVCGTRSRQLLRNLAHTSAVHGFVAALAVQARSTGWEVVQLDPPTRASRYFRHRGTLRSVHPDAFGILRRGEETWPFFLEWERRAVRPVTMAARLAPYLRYYSTRRPIDDHGMQPTVMVVFDDDLAAAGFLRVARREMERSGVVVPLLVSDRGTVGRLGPLGPAWRKAGEWQSNDALPATYETLTP